jgi:hypothetical protein
MKRTTLTKHIEAFKTEALMLLRFQLAYNRIRNFNDFKNISRSDYVDKLISLKSIENDILFRICKFDDIQKDGLHSFLSAKREIKANHPNRNEIFEKIEHFKKSISQVKENRRHVQLAHLKIGEEDNQYELRYDFSLIIQIIIEIIDLMNITEINYIWKDGKSEKFDLKEEILNK